MEQVNDIMELISEQIGRVANSQVVVGTPTELDGKTIVPISRVSIGLGGGGGTGEGDTPQTAKHRRNGGKGKGTGGGTGGGGKVRPVAVVVFGKEGVDVLPIGDKQGRLEKFFDKLPDLVEKFKDMDLG